MIKSKYSPVKPAVSHDAGDADEMCRDTAYDHIGHTLRAIGGSLRPGVALKGHIAVSGQEFHHLLWYAPDTEGHHGTAQSAKTGKILYIEDDVNNAQLMKRVLEADGYSVSLASNGAVGLDKANREHPDLILLDIYMFGLNGHEVARRLRQMKDTKDTPILVISASPNADDKRLSKEAGCNGYISKPIDVDQISNQVAAYL